MLMRADVLLDDLWMTSAAVGAEAEAAEALAAAVS